MCLCRRLSAGKILSLESIKVIFQCFNIYNKYTIYSIKSMCYLYKFKYKIMIDRTSSPDSVQRGWTQQFVHKRHKTEDTVQYAIQDHSKY